MRWDRTPQKKLVRAIYETHNEKKNNSLNISVNVPAQELKA